MSIDTDTVRKVAHLARIAVREDELAPLADELNSILAWVEQLGEVDTEGVEPMSSVVEVSLPRREDVVGDTAPRDELLANAPEVEEGFFVVPKVVE